MDWIFSGIGSTIIGIIVTLLIGGGLTTYKVINIRRKKRVSSAMENIIEHSQIQLQSSGDYSPVLSGNNIQYLCEVKNTTNNYNQQPIIVIRDNFIKELIKDEFNKDFVAIQESLNEKLSSSINSFQTIVNYKFNDIYNAIEALKHPEVYKDTLNAIKAAAFSNRQSDFEVLAELLLERYRLNNDVSRNAGISIAINIVNQVSDDAILGVTLLLYYTKFISYDCNVTSILNNLDNVFSKLMYSDLPRGKDWIYNLEMLNAVSLNYMEKYKDAPDRYRELLSDYIVTGIAKESDAYEKAIKVIKEASFPCPLDEILIDNDLLEGYLVVNGYLISNLNKGIQLKITKDGNDKRYDPTDKQKDALRKVLSLYCKAGDKQLKVKNNFYSEWSKRSNLTKFSSWLKQMPCNVILTPIGMALAQANAKRLITVPNFEEK